LGDAQQVVEGWNTCWRVCGELRTDDSYAFAKVRVTVVLLQLLDSSSALTTSSQCRALAGAAVQACRSISAAIEALPTASESSTAAAAAVIVMMRGAFGQHPQAWARPSVETVCAKARDSRLRFPEHLRKAVDNCSLLIAKKHAEPQQRAIRRGSSAHPLRNKAGDALR
jgi:hypothetical protein